MKGSAAAAAAAICLAGLAVPGGAAATFPGTNGRFLFSQEPPGRNDPPHRERVAVFSIAPDGAGLTRLAPPVSFHPSASPDGSRIAFVHALGLNEATDLVVMAADGTGLRRLTSTPAVAEEGPTWSPDGTRIMYSTNLGSLRVVNADGSGDREVTRGVDPNNAFRGYGDRNPDWSPDGAKIALQRIDREEAPAGGSGEDLWVMNPDGSGAQKVIDRGQNPRWFPDSSRIAYSRIIPGRGPRAFTARPDGSDEREIPVLDAPFTASPVPSPDGSRIALRRFDLASAEVWTMAIDGSRAERVHVVDRDRSSTGIDDWAVLSPLAPVATRSLPLKRRHAIAAVVRRGLSAPVVCAGACKVVTAVLADSSELRSARTLVLGRGSKRLRTFGRTKVVVKLRREAKRRLRGVRRLTVRVRTRITARDGTRQVSTKRTTLVR